MSERAKGRFALFFRALHFFFKEQRERNAHGDFVVKKVLIPDLVVPQLVEEKGDTSSEESEEEVKAVVEEVVVKGKLCVANILIAAPVK